jgi:hypothetical protein
MVCQSASDILALKKNIGKAKEIEAMEKGGNSLINRIFEGKLTAKQMAVVKPDKHTELDPRSDFIYDKYQHRKWFDEKLAKEKSLFTKPSAKRVSNGEFDAFFALRTKDAASDDWHENGENESNTRTKPDATFDVLNMTFQRMDSKREMLETIRGLEKETGDQNLSPRRVSQKNRRIKDIGSPSERKVGGTTSSNAERARPRRNDSGDGEKRRVPPDRTKSASSGGSDAKDRRRGAARAIPMDDSNDTKLNHARSPGAGLRSGHSSLSTGLVLASKISRTRGIGRTKSMDNDDCADLTRRRSKSGKRGVRRVQSSHDAEVSVEGGNPSVSMDSLDSNASSRSTSRRVRQAKTDIDDGIAKEEVSKPSGRRPRKEDNDDGIAKEEVSKPSGRRPRKEDSARPKSTGDNGSSRSSRSRSRPRKAISSAAR